MRRNETRHVNRTVVRAPHRAVPVVVCLVAALGAWSGSGSARGDVCDGQGNATLQVDSERIDLGDTLQFTIHGERFARVSIVAGAT